MPNIPALQGLTLLCMGVVLLWIQFLQTAYSKTILPLAAMQERNSFQSQIVLFQGKESGALKQGQSRKVRNRSPSLLKLKLSFTPESQSMLADFHGVGSKEEEPTR